MLVAPLANPGRRGVLWRRRPPAWPPAPVRVRNVTASHTTVVTPTVDRRIDVSGT